MTLNNSKIKILTNPKKAWAKELSHTVRKFLISKGYKIVKKGADVSICIGGDGTILFAHHKNRLEGKILGIGSKTSYLCQIRNYNWKEKLIPILEADDTFAPLSLVCSTSNSKPSLYTAINDFVIHSIDYRVVEISLLVKSPASQTKEFSFRGDGLIVSTPIGSNAYAYSAGGEKVDPKSQSIQIVPICPFKRQIGPMIFDSNVVLEISAKKRCALIKDGIFAKFIESDTPLRINNLAGNIILLSGVGFDE